jgi:hypothetical protein
MKRAIGVLLSSGLLLAATPESFGGWAVVTFLDVPAYLEAGTPTTLRFKVRQHGLTLLEGREPSLIVGDVGLPEDDPGLERLPAREIEPGVYQATVTPGKAGLLAVTVDMDLANLRPSLLPFRVVAPDNGAVELSPVERGRQLFVAKGCAACHAKLAGDPNARYRWTDFGPPLTARTFPAEYLRMKLRDPAAARTEWPGGVVMPRLELIGPEIEALVRYLNAPQAAPSG